MLSDPTRSITASAPLPLVASRMVAAASSSATTPTSAPTSVASARASGLRSTTITLVGVRCFRSWMARCPSPPAPITTAEEPGSRMGIERLTAWYGVRAASVSGAASAGSRSPMSTSSRSEGTRRYGRHAAVSPQTDAGVAHLVQVLAEVVHALDAPVAVPAARGAVHGHRLADLPAPHAGAEGVHPAGVLVAEGERHLPRHHVGLEVVDEVEVRVAEPGTADLHHDLAGAGLRVGHVLHLGLLLERDQPQRAHGTLLPAVRADSAGFLAVFYSDDDAGDDHDST